MTNKQWYEKLRYSGMLWELFPKATGEWDRDKHMIDEWRSK